MFALANNCLGYVFITAGAGPALDPDKDIVVQRALWREKHKAETEQLTRQVQAASGDSGGKWVTIGGHPVLLKGGSDKKRLGFRLQNR